MKEKIIKKEKRKKTRRSKTNQNTFKNMSIYYINIRGVKSKINSLREIVEEQNPHIISINETLLGKEEKNRDTEL